MINKQTASLLLCISAAIILPGYASGRRTHEQLNGVLWTQTSVECNVSAVQAFRTAAVRAAEALSDPDWTAALEQSAEYQNLPPAVITDVDETVLDNSPFQARLVKSGAEYSSALWEKWVNETQAAALPGAREFIALLKSKGVKVFYVTNRSQEEPTLKNIRAVLDPDATAENVLCKNEQPGWGSDKTSRRALIARKYRILLLIGDDYNDFAFLGNVNPRERIRNAQDQSKYWGVKWILISNPLYGNWERSLYYGSDCSLSDSEKLKAKYQYLDTKD